MSHAIPSIVSEPGEGKIRIHIIRDRCKGCGFCIEFCPKNVLGRTTNSNSRGYYPPYVLRGDECIGCGLCERLCPDFAIYLER